MRTKSRMVTDVCSITDYSCLRVITHIWFDKIQSDRRGCTAHTCFLYLECKYTSAYGGLLISRIVCSKLFFCRRIADRVGHEMQISAQGNLYRISNFIAFFFSILLFFFPLISYLFARLCTSVLLI